MIGSIFTTGFMLGASFIVAIGSQNAFVLQQGLRRQYVGAVVALCIAGDVTLILCGAFGVGALIQQWPFLTCLMSVGGAIFLTLYGLRAAKRAARPYHAALIPQATQTRSCRSVLLTAAAFTFLNPHVYLDTVILLGTLASTYHDMARVIFVSGAMTASTVWFLALGYGARWLGPLFAKPIAWRILDGLIAVSMLLIAGQLWFTAYASMH